MRLSVHRDSGTECMPQRHLGFTTSSDDTTDPLEKRGERAVSIHTMASFRGFVSMNGGECAEADGAS